MTTTSPVAPPSVPSFRVSAAFLVFAVLIAFHKAPFLDFVDYDDVIISQTPALQGGLTREAWHFALTESPTNLWHPLTFLSHALDHEIFGSWAGGHHLTNVLFHLATALLLLAWLRRYTKANGLALAVTLLFAIHPLRVESVIWISERKDVLSAFFYLLTITLYSRWAEQGRSGRRFYLLAVASATLGLFSKPSLMTLPAALLLIDFWPLQRLDLKHLLRIPNLGKRLIEKITFLVIALIAATVAWMTWSGNQFLGEPPEFSFGERVGYVLFTYLTYLSKTFFPAGMAAFHPYPAEIGAAPLILAALLFVIFSAIAIWRRSHSPWLLFGWLWFVGLIIPGSGLITISNHFAPDRYTYLAHIGLFVALAWELVAQSKRIPLSPKLGWSILITLCLPLLFLTHQQSLTWKNPISLWRHAISVSDNNYVAHNQLGLRLLDAKRIEESIKELENAVAAYPDFPISKANLSQLHASRGNFEEAIAWFIQAGPELPDRAHYRDELISFALQAEKPDAAATIWNQLIEENPNDPETRVGAGDFFYEQKQNDLSLEHYRAAVAIEPNHAKANLTLGALLLRSGEIDEAFPFLQTSAKHAPNPAEAASSHRTLAQAFLLKQEWSLAIEQYYEAVKLTPGESRNVNELAQLLLDCPDASLQDPAQALRLAKTLPVQVGKDGTIPNPRYLRTLARSLSRTGASEQAAKVANVGLQVVAAIQKTAPLPEPWTTTELDSLEKGFRQLVE